MKMRGATASHVVIYYDSALSFLCYEMLCSGLKAENRTPGWIRQAAQQVFSPTHKALAQWVGPRSGFRLAIPAGVMSNLCIANISWLEDIQKYSKKREGNPFSCLPNSATFNTTFHFYWKKNYHLPTVENLTVLSLDSYLRSTYWKEESKEHCFSSCD